MMLKDTKRTKQENKKTRIKKIEILFYHNSNRISINRKSTA